MPNRYFNVLYFLLLCLTIGLLPAYGQTDTEFWFAAPATDLEHETGPIRLRFSALDQGGTITVTQPANASFRRTITINPNSSRTLDLTSARNLIENRQANRVNPNGLRITSTVPITCYYEVGNTLNIDIFALKGANSLGQEFVVPGQNFWNSATNFSGSWSTFEIVATQNNTIVTVVPSNTIEGHAAQDTFSILLNRGQTYSGRATQRAANRHVTGSIINANKPIAVTVADDGLVAAGGCIDVTGDQIVPVNVVGTEYIVSRGRLSDERERVFFTAIEDSTEVQVNGNAPQQAFLNRGEVAAATIVDASTFITSTKPVYLWHVTGIGCELGGALLPSINCKGSTQLGFTRSSPDFFFVNLLVRNGGQGLFQFNGNPNVIQATAFTAVPGTNGEWVAGQFEFNLSQVPINSGNLITNTDFSFQVGILDGGPSNGTRFGYFSNFASLYIGDDLTLCDGETRTLDAGAGAIDYLWSDGSDGQTLTIDEPGIYWAEVTNTSGCTLRDSIRVEQITKNFVDLPDTVRACDNTGALLNAGRAFAYNWSTGESTQTITADTTGQYSVQVVSLSGCTDTDTLFVDLQPAPVVDLGPDETFCLGDTLILDVTTPNAIYNWPRDSTGPTYGVAQSEFVEVTVTVDLCNVEDQKLVLFEDPPIVTLPDTVILCQSDTFLLGFDVPDGAYLWTNSNGDVVGTERIIQVTQPSTYTVTVSRGVCVVVDSTVVIYEAPPVVNLGPDLTICEGDTAVIDAGARPGGSFVWNNGNTSPTLAVTQPGIYWVDVSVGACLVRDSITVQTTPRPVVDLGSDTTLCAFDPITFNAAATPATYTWSTGSTDTAITVNSPDTYWVAVTRGPCLVTDTVALSYDDPPTVLLRPDTAICTGDSLLLDPGPISGNPSYLWNDGSTTPTLTAGEDGFYSVTVTRGACTVTDGFRLVLNPVPNAPALTGSASVCPGVTQVLYWVADSLPDLTYQWSVTGGTAAPPTNNGRIRIDWGDTRNNAQVTTTAINTFGCTSSTSQLDVRINTFLQTQAPQGLTDVCLNLKDENLYSVINTNGSSYNWQVAGGQIVEGQGTNEVSISWDGVGNHTLQVSESSVTQDTVCFGESNIVPVRVFEDTTRIDLRLVTVNADDRSVIVQWQANDPSRLQPPLNLLRDLDGSPIRIEFNDITTNNFVQGGSDIDDDVYIFRVGYENGCQQRLVTPPLNNGVLTGIGSEAANTIELSWNAFPGWVAGLERYEVWRRLDDEADFSLFAELPPNATELGPLDALDGFVHRFRVAAVEQGTGQRSWSNRITLTFEHPLTFHNVFTPNGDNINDNFVVGDIEVYPNNQVSIYNRYGKQVFNAAGYRNDWNGGNLAAGVYFYVVRFNDEVPREFRGWVQIVR